MNVSLEEPDGNSMKGLPRVYHESISYKGKHQSISFNPIINVMVDMLVARSTKGLPRVYQRSTKNI